jgi:hypothetical protein
MPLKHTTETLLVFLLGTVMVATGIVIPTLTTLETGIAPWAIVFVIAVAYPLALSRLLKRNRADYTFRMLHWVPAALLLILLLLQAIVYALPLGQPVLDWYTWGWALPGVATGFFLLAFFCLRVVRRWAKRVVLLTVAFVPFMVGAVASEYNDWNREIAAALWEGEWWEMSAEQGALVAQVDSNNPLDEKNLEMSEDPLEETYRERLRAIEGRRERIAERLEERRMLETEEGDSKQVVAVVEESSSSAGMDIRQASSMPTVLPNSGFGWSTIMLTMFGFYTAAIHARTRKRTVALDFELGITN